MARLAAFGVVVALGLSNLAPVRAATTVPAAPSVQQLLDRRSAAVASGDRAAWVDTVDPEAPASFRDAQIRMFDGLRSLPLASYSLKIRTDDSGNLDPRPDHFLPETRQVYRLAGYDDRDAVDSLWWTYVERTGHWYVAAADDLSAVGLDTARNLWDLGPVRVVPTAHFLVISHPEQAARASALAALAEEAVGILATRWGRPWSQRIPLIVPGSVDELATILQASFDLDNFVAFTVYSSVRDDGYAVTAPRIYVQDRNLGRYGRAFQVETLVHELTHAATVPLIGPFIPTWVHEGVADWVAKGERTDERAPAGARLPRDYEFSTGGGTAILRAYDESRSAIAHLAAVRGTGAPGELFATLGAVKVAPGSVDAQVDAALRRVAGQPEADFERNWVGGGTARH